MFKTISKRSIQKTVREATVDSIDNKIANKIRKVLKNSQQNNSETVTTHPACDVVATSHLGLI